MVEEFIEEFLEVSKLDIEFKDVFLQEDDDKMCPGLYSVMVITFIFTLFIDF